MTAPEPTEQLPGTPAPQQRIRKPRKSTEKPRVIVPLPGGEGFQVLPAPHKRPSLSKAMEQVRKRATRGTVTVPEPVTDLVIQAAGGSRKYDWEAALDYYINMTEDKPLSAIAEMFGIPRDQFYNRTGKERWQHQRLAHQTTLLKERRRARQFKTVKEAEAFDDSALSTAKLGASLITGRLAQIAELFNAKRDQYQAALEKVKQGISVPREELYSAVNYREMTELAKAMEVFQNIGRRALGTDVQTINMLMDGEHGAASEQIAASIADELGKVDPDRIAAMFDALVDAGIAGLEFDEQGEVIGFDLEGEVIDPEAQRAINGEYISTDTQRGNSEHQTESQEKPSE